MIHFVFILASLIAASIGMGAALAFVPPKIVETTLVITLATLLAMSPIIIGLVLSMFFRAIGTLGP